MDDTGADAARLMTKLWHEASPRKKLDKLLSLGRMLNELTRAELRHRYPHATGREIELRLASRTLDRDTMIRAFGWDPDVHGR